MISVIKAWNSVTGKKQNVNCSGNAIHVIDEEDAAIHQGEGYHFGQKLILAPDEQVVFAGITGPSRRVHFQGLDVEAVTGPIEINFHRNCQISSGTGVEQTTHNRRFDITSASQFKVFAEPTIIDSGDLVVPTANLAAEGIGGSSTPAGGNAFFHGFVLDYNTVSLLFLKNTSTASATLWANFTYHEPQHL